MGKKKAGIILGAIALAAAAAVGIWYFLGNGGKDSNDRVYVQKVSAIMGTATGVQNRYSGVVQPQKTVEVNADSERTVKEILVEVGDEVTEGTPLFSYDTEDLKMELEQAKLELENQDIEISNYRNQIQELTKERNAAAEGDKFEYTTQIQTIETQIKQAEYEKSSKKLEMDKVQKKIDNSQVTSTASGMVKSINDGNSQDQEASAFMTILSTGEYRIQGMANEQNVGMISSGTEVIIRSRVDEELTWTGTVDSLDTGEPSEENDDMSMGDSDNMSSSSKYPFYVVMDDADGLMLGQHVLIELNDGQMEEKEGIWLFSGYIVREDQQESETESILENTEASFDQGGTGIFSDPDQNQDGEGMLLDPNGSQDGEGMLLDPNGSQGIEEMSFDPNGSQGIEQMSFSSTGSQGIEQKSFSSTGSQGIKQMSFSSTGSQDGEGMLYDPEGDLEDGDMLYDPEGDLEDGDMLYDPEGDLEDGDMIYDSEENDGVLPEGGTAYVWADNGNGRLEKRIVELGEYDEALDEYEILSGLTEDDLIAWPMEGLYEGVKTVTDMEEVDYTSDLYNQDNGTEALSDTENYMDDFDVDNFDADDLDTDDLDWGDDADWEDDSDWEDDADWEDDSDLEDGDDTDSDDGDNEE